MPITSGVTCEICGRSSDAPCDCQHQSLLGFLSDFRAASPSAQVETVSPQQVEMRRAEAFAAMTVAEPQVGDYHEPPPPAVDPVPAPATSYAPPAPVDRYASPAPPVYPPPAAAPADPVESYAPPAYAPPTHEPQAYAPPAYEPQAYAPPAYAPPVYAPPAGAPVYPADAYGSPSNGASYAPPSLGRRLLSGWTPIAILAVLAAVMVVVAVVLPGASSGPSLKGKTPAAIVQTALAAANKSGSAHVVLKDTTAGHSLVIQGDISRVGGLLNVDIDGHSASIMTSGQTIYFKADAGYLEANGGLSSATAARMNGQWISVPVNSSSPMAQLGQMVESQTFFNDLVNLTGPVSEGSSSGDAVTLTGTLPSNSITQDNGAGDQAQLVVSDRSPFLPETLSYSDAQSGSNQITFSQWGENVTLTPLSSVIPVPGAAAQNASGAGSQNPDAARAAQENLRNALTAELTYYTNNQAFDSTAAANGVQLVLPSLRFVARGPVTPGDEVLLSASGSLGVVMTVAGADGNCYSIETDINLTAGTEGTYFYQAPGSGSGARTACRAPAKLAASLPTAPTNRSASTAPRTWSLGF